MEHNEAIAMMASEKYLLDELEPGLRDAYEEHYFGCAACALDVQLGAAFIDQSKKILPTMRAAAAKPGGRRTWFSWLSLTWSAPAWLSPVVLAPALACLLAVVAYQNLVVYPALEAAVIAPQVLPAATMLHDDTRAAIPVVFADLKLGSTITVELPVAVNYDSYKFDFFDAKGKVLWSRTARGSGRSEDTLSIWLPGGVKQETYKLSISGIDTGGTVTAIKEQIFDLQIKK